MWLSDRREQLPVSTGCALTGPVTLPGDPAAVWLEGERRGVMLCAPGGYHWMPGTGDEVLVLKAGQEGESPCALGTVGQHLSLRPGEVLIEAGKASVRLTPEGRVELNGQIWVNGSPLEPPPVE